MKASSRLRGFVAVAGIAATFSLPVAAHAESGVFEITTASQCASIPKMTQKIVNGTEREIVLYSDANCTTPAAILPPRGQQGDNQFLGYEG